MSAPRPRSGARRALSVRSAATRRRRRRRRLRALAAALGLGLLGPAPSPVLAGVPPAGTSPGTLAQVAPAQVAPAQVALAQVAPVPSEFEPPVEATITDGWRPPSSPYGPGNRGWQYGTADGDPVRAAGPGTVTFAGHVGGVQAVTVTHRGGLRTSYTRLATVDVGVQQRVELGQTLGTAMTELHFGVRIGDRYVDPAVLFEPGALVYRARLRPL